MSDSVSSKNINIIEIINKNWQELDETQKNYLLKIWNVLTYKWQLQLLFNLPFVAWWILDSTIIQVHNFDLQVIEYLNLPLWLTSLIGFNQTSS